MEAIIDAPIETVWKNWTSPENIVMWNVVSEDWRATWVENDLRIQGKFYYKMEAKDGSASFDFSGIYNEVQIYMNSLPILQTTEEK